MLQKNFNNFIRDSEPDDHNVIDSDQTVEEQQAVQQQQVADEVVSEDIQCDVANEYQADQFLDEGQVSDESSDNNFGQRGTQAIRPNLLVK